MLKRCKNEQKKQHIPLKETAQKVKPRYVRKPKGVAQIADRQGFIGLDGLLENHRKYTMNKISKKDSVTKVVAVDKTTNII